MQLLRDILGWLWHLLPGNPILVRVVAAAGKRPRHLWARVAYLGVLFVTLFLVGNSVLDITGRSLADLAKQSTLTFRTVSIVQLLLMSFIAPVFAASAITQEKDSSTFHILLTTPLSAGQIVIGMLMSRLFLVFALLLSGVPIFCITMLYGGVTTREVFLSVGLSAVTALVTGSLAIMIGIIKVGTRRTIFSFFLGVAVYLLAVGILGLTAWGQLNEAPLAAASNYRMSWLAPVHPLLALMSVTGQSPAPPIGDVYKYGWPARWLLAHPAEGYMVVMTLISIAMIAATLFFVRAGQKEGEPTLWNRVVAVFSRREPTVERTQRPRRVWNNPIAWREATTRASAAGRSAARTLFVIGGLIAAVVLLMAFENSWWGFKSNDPTTVRPWLRALVLIELVSILLVVATTAATALTREKETATLELLLTTPLTSKYIMAGLLRGLVSFVIPLIAVPTFTVLIFVIADLRKPGDLAVTAAESILLMPPLLTSFAALAALAGLQFSLQFRKSAQSVMVSAAVILLGAGVLFGCGSVMLQGGGTVGAIFAPFSPLNAAAALVDHHSLFDETQKAASVEELANARWIRTGMSLLAILVYAGVSYGLYVNLVKNFDMTVRRQSA